MDLSNEKVKSLIADLKLIAADQLDAAFQEAERAKQPLATVLVEKDLISDDNIGKVIADHLGYPFIDLDTVAIDPAVLELLPEVVAKKQKAIVFSRDRDAIKVAMVNPGNLALINLLRKKTGQEVILFYTTSENIRSALAKYQTAIETEFGEIIQANISAAKQGAKAEDVPIIKIVDTLIEHAYQNKASDIHLEPTDQKTLVRFRIDGILHDIIGLPKELHPLLITRLKILAQLRTDEHQSAQDGKIRTDVDDEKVDIRVSIIPIVEGEKAVLRLLSEKARQVSLEDLGLSHQDLLTLKKAYAKPYGMILATGPTGAGKTTTLYAILKILNKREVNISTIEDPVEYDIEGVNQIQANPKTNLTFASGLRSILRQDPNIIMVGEIRDEETAGIAINAAMTGHLVLSTLHTNDAPTALPRFLNMGIEPFLIASTVNVIIAQRLVRRNCARCVVSRTVTTAELQREFSAKLISSVLPRGKKEVRLYAGKGCTVCGNTGYAGRVGVFEVLVVSEKIRELIMQRVDADQIRTQAIAEGMKTMVLDGVQKALAGITTLSEVLRAVRE